MDWINQLGGVAVGLFLMWVGWALTTARERERVWQRAGRLIGDWEAFNRAGDGGLTPMPNAGITVIQQLAKRWGPDSNTLEVYGRDNEASQTLDHQGHLILSKDLPHAATRVVIYAGTKALAVNQGVTIIDHNTLSVVAIDQSQQSYWPHILKRRQRVQTSRFPSDSAQT